MPQATAELALEADSATPRALGKGRKRGRIVRQRITALTWGNPAAITARCVVVTTATAHSMAVIHHPQPLCLEGDEIAACLDPTTALGDIEEILASGSKREPGLTLERAGEPRA